MNCWFRSSGYFCFLQTSWFRASSERLVFQQSPPFDENKNTSQQIDFNSSMIFDTWLFLQVYEV